VLISGDWSKGGETSLKKKETEKRKEVGANDAEMYDSFGKDGGWFLKGGGLKSKMKEYIEENPRDASRRRMMAKERGKSLAVRGK